MVMQGAGVLPFSGAIPIGELSLDERRRMRLDALTQLRNRAINVKSLAGSPSELVIRDILPMTDLGLAPAGLGVGVDNWWVVDVAAAILPTAARVNWINIALAVNRMLVIYGGAALSANPAIATLFFQSGPGGATVKGVVQLEACYAMLEPAYYLAKACLWDPQETVFISFLPRINVAADTDRHVLRGAIAEPLGEFLSGPVI
jgi:hypothetical protein